MNLEIILTFSIIALFAFILFWLFYRVANNTDSQAKTYLLARLQNDSITVDERKEYESQLSNLLQKKQSNSGFKITAFLFALIVPVSFYLYYMLGTPNAKQQIQSISQGQNTSENGAQAPQLSMQEAMTQLEQRLAQNPDDVDGQMLYARSLISLKEYDKAVIAYRKSNELAPNEPVILTELAESIALANNNRSFLGEPETFLKQAVEIDPSNQKALWLYGMTFYEQKNLAKTNELWTKLYGLMSNEAAKKQLFEQLTDVRNKLGINETIVEQQQPKVDVDVENIAINLTINLDELLIDKLEGKPALLYIYAKATTGMPMPIAVIRQSLEQISKTFPIQVTLSDLNNLQPNRTLSSFESVIIGARVSFTGNATPQPGDLQSTEIKVDSPYAKEIGLIIDKIR